MTARIPSLPSLQAFEAAARLSSYSMAAEELALTHSAISHQIKLLETVVSAKLFERRANRMVLTKDGRALLAKVEQGLSVLEEAFACTSAAKSRSGAQPARLRVSVVPSFAARWLLPRLPRFSAAHPEVSVHLISSQIYSNLLDDGVDVAIRYGFGGWHDVAHCELFRESVFPVASPRYRNAALPARPEALAEATLIRCSRQPWLPWFVEAGLPFREPTGGHSFEDIGLAIQAAEEGHGVALARSSLVRQELASGRLRKLFDVTLQDARSYWLLWLPGSRKPQAVRHFLDWLCAEASDSESASPLRLVRS